MTFLRYELQVDCISLLFCKYYLLDLLKNGFIL